MNNWAASFTQDCRNLLAASLPDLRAYMSDLLNFFLKMETGSGEIEPPFLVQFAIPRGRLADARQQGEDLVTSLCEHRSFQNSSHAVQFSIADAVLANQHTDQRVQQMLALMLVHMATDSEQKRDAISAGASKIGYVISLSDEALRAMEQTDGDDEGFEEVVNEMLSQGNSPFKFKFVAATPMAS